MTCIVGIVKDGRVYLAGDSAGSDGLRVERRKEPKVFKNGDFILGYTSSFRMGQILQHCFTPPKRYPEDCINKFMASRFVNAVRKAFDDGGYSRRHHNQELGGSFLIGYKGRLFVMEDDYHIGEVLGGYHAVGCGEGVALGSLYSTDHIESPTERLEIALKAAQEFREGVREPFHFVEQ